MIMPPLSSTETVAYSEARSGWYLGDAIPWGGGDRTSKGFLVTSLENLFDQASDKYLYRLS